MPHFSKGVFMKRAVKAVLFVTSVFLYVNASSDLQPCLQWTKPLPVTGSFGPSFVVPLCCGAGYAVAGTVGDRNETIFLWVADSSGNEIYKKTMSTLTDNQCIGAHCVCSFQQLGEYGFIMAGTRKTRSNPFDAAWIIRIDREGYILWTTVLETDKEAPTIGYNVESISQTRTGTFIVTGQKEGAAWVCCLERNGEVKWSKTLDGAHASSVVQSADGSFLVLGISSTPTLRSVFLHKIGWDGTLAWTRVSSIDAECPPSNTPPSLALAADNLSMLTAATMPGTGNCCITCLDTNAEQQWEKCMSFSGTGYLAVKSLVPYGDNGFLVAGDGAADRYTAPQGLWLARLNASGRDVWQWTTSEAQVSRAVAPAGECGIIVLAERYSSSSNELLLMKLMEPRRTVDALAYKPGDGKTTKGSFLANRTAAPRDFYDVAGRLVSCATPAGRTMLRAGIYVSRTGSAKTLRFGNSAR
jgi:hypothetical protein